MKDIFTTIAFCLLISTGAVAQNNSSEATPMDSSEVAMQQEIQKQKAQQELGMVAAQKKNDNRSVLGLYNITGPQQMLAGPATQSDQARFRGTLETYLVASRNLRVAEVDPDRLGAIYQEFTTQEIGLTEFVNQEKQRGEWIGVDYILTQEDATSILNDLGYYRHLPGWMRKGAIANSPKQVVNLAVYDASNGSKVNVLAGRKGYSADARGYANQLIQDVETLSKIEDVEQRKMYAEIQHRIAFNSAFSDPSLMTMTKMFAIMATGIAAHALIQGSVFTKVVAGGAYAAGGYFMWSATKGMQKTRDIVYEDIDQMIEKYESKYGPYK
jgi:hypothetical protein